MVTTQSVLEQLTGKQMVDTLVKVMAENFADFAEARERYFQTMGVLREALGESAPSVDAAMEAIGQQAASNLFFSGFLGIKANLDHFIDPVARTFLEVNTEAYLRTSTARRLPEYEQAQKIRNQFYASLSSAQRELFEDVTVYVSYLETAGPKLAHYYGYLLGNEFLYRVIPGYGPDTVLTIQYRRMMEKDFGRAFPWNC